MASKNTNRAAAKNENSSPGVGFAAAKYSRAHHVDLGSGQLAGAPVGGLAASRRLPASAAARRGRPQRHLWTMEHLVPAGPDVDLRADDRGNAAVANLAARG